MMAPQIQGLTMMASIRRPPRARPVRRVSRGPPRNSAVKEWRWVSHMQPSGTAAPTGYATHTGRPGDGGSIWFADLDGMGRVKIYPASAQVPTHVRTMVACATA